MRVACEFLVRECARGVVRRHFCPLCRLPSTRNNEPVIGILGRVCISIQDVVVPSMSPFRLFEHSNFSFVSFHARDLYFPRLRSLLVSCPRRALVDLESWNTGFNEMHSEIRGTI